MPRRTRSTAAASAGDDAYTAMLAGMQQQQQEHQNEQQEQQHGVAREEGDPANDEVAGGLAAAGVARNDGEPAAGRAADDVVGGDDEPLVVNQAAAQRPPLQGCNPLCELPALALGRGDLHFCRHGRHKAHAPCMEEVEVVGRVAGKGGMMRVCRTGFSFPIELVHRDGRGDDTGAVSGFSEICKGCLGELKQKWNANPFSSAAPGAGEGERNPETIALYAATYPADAENVVPQDVMEEMLQTARDGSAGAEAQGRYERAVVEYGAAGARNRNSAPGARLAAVRRKFTPAGVRKSSKAPSTFTKHQGNNSRFILYLYENHSAMLHPAISQKLDTIDKKAPDFLPGSAIDFSGVEEQYPRYVKQKGKKTLLQRKEDYRETLLCNEIKAALGEPGSPTNGPTVDFGALNANIDAFVRYLTEKCRNDDGTEEGQIQKETSYTGQRSSLTYLYRRYRQVQPPEFVADLKEAMEGVKRLSSQARQHGEGNIGDGDRALSWELYEQFNKWMYDEGTEEGLFGVAFSKLTNNLACRGKSTGQICTKHMQWGDDSMEIAFGHSKDAQTGENAIKKLPRNSYCNPFNLALCPITSVFDYMALNPDVISCREEAFFQGSLSAQSQRFGRLVSKICKKHQPVIEQKFGFDIRTIGVHSWRKCAHTKLNCGSTAGPSGAAACIRGGHKMGGSKDRYIAQEKASDQFCGRILAGLPEHSADFAVSHPDFKALGGAGITEAERQRQQKQIDDEVNRALQSIFGAENLSHFREICPLLRVGLASHLHHIAAYDMPVSEDRPNSKILPAHSPLRNTPLFTNPRIRELKKHVCVSKPWEASSKYFPAATGIPPHVTQFAYLRDLSERVFATPERIEEILDRRGMIGQATMGQVVTAVMNDPGMVRMCDGVASLLRMAENGNLGGGITGNGNATSNNARVPERNLRLMREFKHGENLYRRVPTSWKFPKLNLQPMFAYWHCGDEANHIPPMKFLETKDIKHIGKRAPTTLGEIRRVMNLIDDRAKSKGCTIKDYMTLVEANTLYSHGESAIDEVVPAETQTMKKKVNLSRLKFCTVVKYIQQQKRNSK